MVKCGFKAQTTLKIQAAAKGLKTAQLCNAESKRID